MLRIIFVGGRQMRAFSWKDTIGLVLLCGLSMPICGQDLAGTGPALGPADQRIRQQDVGGKFSLEDLRRAGFKVFATRFNKADGYGDGPVDDHLTGNSVGNRGTLAGNGTFLRLNGLDAQSCMDCHAYASTTSLPPSLAPGGGGGISNLTFIDASYVAFDGSEGPQATDGRISLPPHLYGLGGVQQLAREMTAELQALKQQALDQPGTSIDLYAKGIYFGRLVANGKDLDTSALEGIDADLIVRPFGRLAEFASVREILRSEMRFHFGMEPSEAVGEGVDNDGDGIRDEIYAGELSALEIFLTTQASPFLAAKPPEVASAELLLLQTGCADCHTPALVLNDTLLNHNYPDVPTQPDANTYYRTDLRAPLGSNLNGVPGEAGTISVPLYSDLKRHDIGLGAGVPFMTARLWGLGDTAPYLHDGRALTVHEAIMLHAGEAGYARDRYAALDIAEKNDLLTMLLKLRNPSVPNRDVLNSAGRAPIGTGQPRTLTVGRKP